MGRRYHVHPDLGWVPVPRRRAGCLQPARDRLVHDQPLAHPPRARSTPSTWRFGNADPTASSITPIRDRSIPRSPSVTAAASPVCARRPDRSATAEPVLGHDPRDNAFCESFFATLECELLDRRRFRSHAEARMAVFEFIEGWYNPRRRHSAIGYLSPINYESRRDRTA